MNKWWLGAACWMVSTICVAETQVEGPRRVAVIVGANQAAAGRSRLRFSHKDAQSVADVLVDAGHFARQDVHVLLDPEPQTVLTELDQRLKELKAIPGETMLLFYYSGHSDDQALFPNGKPLALSALKERLESQDATVRIGIIDACRGGAWTRSKGMVAEPPFEIRIPLTLATEGSILMASSSGLENAHETDSLQGSFFTHHLVAGLRGAADQSADGRVTAGEAFAYAQSLTVRDTAMLTETPQHPSFSLNLRGRSDLTLTTVDDGPSLMEVQQKRGPLQLMELRSGISVMELPEGERTVKLALPQGIYLIRRKDGERVFSRELLLKSRGKLVVTEESLLPQAAPLLASKGGPIALEPLAVAAASPGASAGNAATVIVSDDSGIDASSLNTLRHLTASRLAARHVSLVEDPRLAQVRPIDQETLQIAREAGASRIYVLQPSRLGSKVMLTLQERNVKSSAIEFDASLTAHTLEESDKVIPRLVDAILDRKPVEDTAEITSVTKEEAAPYEKRPGEKFWALGLPFGLTGGGTKGAFGLSLGWHYESEHFGVGFQLLGAASGHFGAFLAGIDAQWIPLSGSWSPYVAPGVGYMFLSKDNLNGGGVGFTAEVGAEFLRLHHFRILVGAQALLPAYSLDNNLLFGFSAGAPEKTWVPVFLLHTRIAF